MFFFSDQSDQIIQNLLSIYQIARYYLSLGYKVRRSLYISAIFSFLYLTYLLSPYILLIFSNSKIFRTEDDLSKVESSAVKTMFVLSLILTFILKIRFRKEPVIYNLMIVPKIIFRHRQKAHILSLQSPRNTKILSYPFLPDYGIG